MTSSPSQARQRDTRARGLGTLAKYRHDFALAANARHWSPALETCSRDELRAIQNDKLAALTPFLYENSDFYRRRFDRLGLAPSDIRTVDDLISLRGVKMFPAQIEGAVRAVPGVGDEFEIVLSTRADGLDVMTVRVEHPAHAAGEAVAAEIAGELRTRWADVEVLKPDTLAKTEFKAKRVRDERKA